MILKTLFSLRAVFFSNGLRDLSFINTEVDDGCEID